MIKNYYIRKRKHRAITYKNHYKIFTRGDAISLYYRLYGIGHSFIGICLAVRKKSMALPSSAFLFRNVFSKVPVELSITLYGLCRLNFKLLDYARKRFTYRGSKLYYLREKKNSQSLVKM